MSTFVLVHGSPQNESCWERVANCLTSRGHSVVAPDLPKHAPDWGLREYAGEIARWIRAADTVLVGHSLAGCFYLWLPKCATAVWLSFWQRSFPSRERVFASNSQRTRPCFRRAGSRWARAGSPMGRNKNSWPKIS